MYAAASGKGNLGIPKKVAAEFVASDKPGKLPKYAPKSRGREAVDLSAIDHRGDEPT
jgi:hypothetical protein